MTPQRLAALTAHSADLGRQCAIAGIDADGLEDFIVGEMARSDAEWDVETVLLDLCSRMPDRAAKARTLGRLLLMPTHQEHQAVTMEIQQLADPASVAAIQATLERGFADFAYTGSDDNVIAKWRARAVEDRHARGDRRDPRACALAEPAGRRGDALSARAHRRVHARAARSSAPDALTRVGAGQSARSTTAAVSATVGSGTLRPSAHTSADAGAKLLAREIGQ